MVKALLSALLLGLPLAAGGVPAFPGAEGGGSEALGGRGGAVIYVTNLNDSGSGSLRACVQTNTPRTCIFRVGGTINLLSELRVTYPYLTVAGHSAPGGGIQLSGKNSVDHVFRVQTHNVIIRYIRIRKGYNAATPGQSGGVAVIRDPAYNVIFDHCSISWTQDENVAVWTNALPAAKQITFSYNIVSEPLYPHPTSVGYGADHNATSNLNDDSIRIDFHHNFIPNSGHRNPLTGNKEHRLINNLWYNWSYYASELEGGVRADIIGNYYRVGRTLTSVRDHEIQVLYPSPYANTASGTPSLYIVGNKGPNQSNPDAENWDNMVQRITTENGEDAGLLSTAYRRTTPMVGFGYPITVHHVNDLETVLLPLVGASQRLNCDGTWTNVRDTTDARLVTEYNANTARDIITDETSGSTNVGGFPVIANGTPCADADADGMPDVWETANGLNPNLASDRNIVNAEGYTNLELYLGGEVPEPIVPSDGGSTLYLSEKILNSLFRSLPGYKPGAIFIGLLTTLPTDSSMAGAVEVTGGNYTRIQVVQDDANWNAPSGVPRMISNKNSIAWTGVTWSATVVGWAVYDAGAAGNALMWFDSADATVTSGVTVRFAGGTPGALAVEHD